jgi:hypothetical protein
MIALTLALVFEITPSTFDDQFSSSISANWKMVDLREACRRLSTATGQKVACADALADRKITVLAENLTTRQVLAAIENTLDGKWVLQEGKWTLINDGARFEDMRAYAQAFTRERDAAFRDRFRLLANLAGKNDAELERIKSDPNPARSELATSILKNRPYANVIAGLPSAELDLLAKGKVMILSTEHAIKHHRTSRLDPNIVLGKEDDPSIKRIAFARVDYDGLELEFRMFTRAENAMGFSSLDFRLPVTREMIDRAVASQPYQEFLDKWPQGDVAVPQGEVAAQPWTAKPAGWTKQKTSMADILEAYHRSTGVPVVAEVLRVPFDPVRGPRPSETENARLNQIAESEGIRLQVTDGVLQARHRDFWSLRGSEIPESTWRVLDTTPVNVDSERQPVRLLADYSAFFARQNMLMMERFELGQLITTAPLPAVDLSLDQILCMHLYGRLTLPQQMDALSAAGLPPAKTPPPIPAILESIGRNAAIRTGAPQGKFFDAMHRYAFWPDQIGNLSLRIHSFNTEMAIGLDNPSRFLHLAFGAANFRVGFAPQAQPPTMLAMADAPMEIPILETPVPDPTPPAMVDCISVTVPFSVTMQNHEYATKRQRAIDSGQD